MTRASEYGLEWELVEGKGQLGLLQENHYRPLFRPDQIPTSLRSEDVWMDIGANIGAFALRAAQYVRQVVAFEPERENWLCLEHNKNLNGLKNVILVGAAVVGGNQTTVPLAISNTFSSTHRVGTIRGRQSINVLAMNINEAVQVYGTNKIKMDCEGTEAEILEAIDLSPIDEIIFEYHFSFLKDTDWSRFDAILGKLRQGGFKILKQPAQKSKSWHTIVWVKKP